MACSSILTEQQTDQVIKHFQNGKSVKFVIGELNKQGVSLTQWALYKGLYKPFRDAKRKSPKVKKEKRIPDFGWINYHEIYLQNDLN